MDEEIERWMKVAAEDYQVAVHLFDTFYPKPYGIICYHCEQAAEKAIKALILKSGNKGGMPKVHDLSFLLNQIKSKFVITDAMYDYADTLTPYGIAARYPNELSLEEHHAKRAINAASAIVEWVRSNL